MEFRKSKLKDGGKTAATSSTKWRSDKLAIIWIGLLLGFSFLGLTHDLETLYATENESVELGAGIESREDFESNVNAAPTHRKLGFIGLMVIGAYCFATAPRGAALGSFSVMAPCLCFLAWTTASAVWSMDRTQTLREIFRIIVYVLVVFSMVCRFESRDILKIIVICMAVSVATVYAGEIAIGAFRPWSGNFRMHGSIHSATLAHHCMMLAISASALSIDSSRGIAWKCLLVFAMITIIFAKTRGALLAAITGLVVIQMFQYRARTNLLIAASFVSVIASIIFVSEISGPKLQEQIGNAVSLGRSEGVTTLTGRLPLWATIWNDCEETRLFGAGYGAFFTTKRTISLASTLRWFPGHSHNAYLETLVDLGYVGLAILIWMIIASFRAAALLSLETRKVAYVFIAGLVAAGIVDGFAEVMFVAIRDLGLFVGIAMTLLMVRHPSDIFIPPASPSPLRRRITTMQRSAKVVRLSSSATNSH